MAEKKAGFFKRVFKFGKKKEEEAVDSMAELEAAAAKAEQAAEAARAKVAAELKAAEDVIKRRAKAEEEKELAAKASEKRFAKEKVENLKAEQKAQAAKAKADAEERKIRAAAEKTEQKALAAKAKAEAAAQKAEEAEIKAAELAEEKQKTKAATKAVHTAKRAAEKAAALALKQKQEAEAQQAAIEQKRADAAAEAERLENERQVILEQEEIAAAEKARLAVEQAHQLAEQEAQEAAAQATAQLEAEAIEAERLKIEAERLEKAAQQQEKIAADQDRLTAEAEAEVASQPTSNEQSLGEAAEQDPKKKKGWLSRLKRGLSRSSNQLTENITAVFTKRKLDEETLQELEDILIQADLGVETAMNITDALAAQRMGKDVSDEEVREFMATEIEKVLEPVAAELELDLDHTPHVILVVGVNGSGKTTTIGKLSQKLYDAGFSTVLVAGDTFRAAAIEQLKIWGDRTQSPTLSRPLGSDSAGLAYDAYQQALDEGRDVMLMDTAGRLQNKTELMDELEKIIRVLKKQDPTAPHTVLLTLDATTGQNALNQVEVFKDVSGVNGLVMTKLDGTARGGIMVAIAAKYKLPVYFLGVGEQVEDLEPFEARDFARSIAGLLD
ncbi:MAG: signal recognition particle-docking protein FtsY [Rhizobiaceae bacterium]